MSRRVQSLPPEIIEKPERGRCLTAVCISWKVITCIVSHVTLVSLVVAYCIGGALLFQHLEGEHELQVKRDIVKIRNNVTDDLWKMTSGELFLAEENWTELAFYRLEKFEKEILKAIKTEGWDGDERDIQLQWTFFGALFYSIIVITTIGYGHIAPRTDWGKVTTIFYAILGIPLMLLCLSNIGDVMASSFRFLYWKVCCYACTRPPRRRTRSSRASSRARQMSQYHHRPSSRSQPPPSIRRSIRVSQRSADSGFVPSHDAGLVHAYSDPELRYHHQQQQRHNFDDSINYPHNNQPPHQHHQQYHQNNNNQRKDWRYSHENEIDNYRNPSRNHIRNVHDNNNYWQPKSPNIKRFSNRNRNRDRINERHSMECDRNWENSFEDLATTKRAHSSRSLRGQSIGRDCIGTSGGGHGGHGGHGVGHNVLNRLIHSPPSNRSRLQGRRNSKFRSKSVDPSQLITNTNDSDNTKILCNQYALEMMDKNELPYSSSGRRGGNRERRESFNKGQPTEKELMMMNCNPSRSLSVPPNQRPRLYGDRLDIPQSHHHHHTLPHMRDGRVSGSGRHGRVGGGGSGGGNDGGGHRQSSYYDIADDYDVDTNDDEFEMKPIRKDARHHQHHHQQPSPNYQLHGRKAKPVPLPPSPRIMSPMGFAVHRQARMSLPDDDDSYYGDEWGSYGDLLPRNKPVPIWLCVFLVISYIIAGAFLFSNWEKWPFLDSVYFCFITLTTIGFGDFVPAQGVKENSKESIALCSLYLLFGISLLAMSFNLVQEEVITNVKEVARRLGILKEEEIDD